MMRLLSHYFEEKVDKQFRTLTSQSINTWGELCQALIKIFVEDSDDSTFLSLIACIKRHPHESIYDFNLIFEKICKSIPTRISPTNAQALIYYRKEFLLNLNVLIIMSSDTFSKVYQMTKTTEHTLVYFRKIQPRSIMPLFPNLPPKQAPLQISHLGVLSLPQPPSKTTIQNQVPMLPALASTSTNTGSTS